VSPANQRRQKKAYGFFEKWKQKKYSRTCRKKGPAIWKLASKSPKKRKKRMGKKEIRKKKEKKERQGDRKNCLHLSERKGGKKKKGDRRIREEILKFFA